MARTSLFITIIVGVALAATPAFAGSGHQCAHGKQGMDPAAHAAKLQEKLGLTEAVTAQVEEIFREVPRGDQADRLKEILSADEYAKFEELMAAHHGDKGRGYGHAGCSKHQGAYDPAAHAGEIQKKLELLDGTTAELEILLRETAKAKAAALAQVEEQFQEKLQLLLTPDEYERYKEMKAECSSKGHACKSKGSGHCSHGARKAAHCKHGSAKVQ